MSTFLQNHPGERDTRPRPVPGNNQQGFIVPAIVLFTAIPVAITFAVLKRLTAIGKINGVAMYALLGTVILLCAMALIAVIRKMLNRNIAEQKKYYHLAGGLNWLSQEKREALQLEAPYCYHTGGWVETLEYWPCEVRLPPGARFKTFTVTTREERLAGNDQAWAVLSGRSYLERIDTLFEGMHSRRFAADSKLTNPADGKAATLRLAELTQLPEAYIEACREARAGKPAMLVWAFDLQRVVELSRTSFMAGLIPEKEAWLQILKASAYAHALFDSLDDFFNNYRLGHAYWCNNFEQTNEVARMQKAYNNDCRWPVKDVPWTKKDTATLPEVIRNGCATYVAEERGKQNRSAIGFSTGHQNTPGKPSPDSEK